jgi:DNA-binding transcriptional LysR family regulator
LKVRLRSLDGVCQMVANGVGISIVPRRAAMRNMGAAPVEIVDLQDAWADRALLLCFRNRQELPPPAHALVETLAAAA